MSQRAVSESPHNPHCNTGQHQSPGAPTVCLPQSHTVHSITLDRTLPHWCHNVTHLVTQHYISSLPHSGSTYHTRGRLTTRLHTRSTHCHTCHSHLHSITPDHMVSENHFTGLHSHTSNTLSHISSSASEICKQAALGVIRGWGASEWLR